MLRAVWGSVCSLDSGTKAVLLLSETLSPVPVYSGWRTHAFQQLWMPGAGPGTLYRYLLYISLSCSLLSNMGIMTVPASKGGGDSKGKEVPRKSLEQGQA